MAVSLFLLSGICVAMVYRKFRNPESVDASQPYLDGDFVPYYLFLFVLLVSTVFLLLRWTNFTLSGYGAMGADTPISPETPLAPQVQRLSFGLIFPVVSLFIYFISPFIVFFIRKLKVKEGVIFSRLSIGFFVSVGLAVFQKISGRSFISDRLGKELKQFYGGFCDFNAFGFFAGVMFLWSTYQIRDKFVMGYITFPVALVGGILSGSRTVYFFLLAGIFNLLYVFIFSAGKGRKSFQVVIIVILILGVAGAVFFAGGTLKDRFSEGYSGDKSLYEKINGLTNGRLWMSQFTLEGIKDNFVPGIGTGNFTFYLAYKNYLPYKESGKAYLFDQSLNHYLQVFIENGVFGFILFCGFMISLFRRADKKLLIGTILFSLFFNNFFWFPEAILLFWVVVAVSVKPCSGDGVGESDKKGFFKDFSFRKKEILVVLCLLVFIGFNVFSFSSLHPRIWARESGIR
ncbi:MAG: O-antigen ligase family protein, partial [bacterium]|nr:O-antigen ligase family protein [bacterium]